MISSGVPSVIVRPGGAEVYWRDRRPEGVVTVRRALDSAGRAQGLPQDEPAMAGELPLQIQGETLTVLVHGPNGEPGVGRYQCAALQVAAR